MADEIPEGMRSNRILSMFLDHALMTILALIILSPWMISYSNRLEEAATDASVAYFPQWAVLLLSIGLGLYLNKDLRKGQSFAKMMFGFRIVDHKSGDIASPMQCMIRNLTAPLFLFEVLILWISPERRIGDFLAGTRLIIDQKQDLEHRPRVIQAIIALSLAIVLSYTMIEISSEGLKRIAESPAMQMPAPE